MMPLRATVAICAFNEEERIGQALESALRQETGYDWEVIVVDDGSTDRTRAEVARVARETVSRCERILYLRIQHAGLSAARNAALRESRGSIVAYLDADALADPSWLDEIVRAFESDEGAVAVAGEIEILNSSVPFARFIDQFHHRRAYVHASRVVPIIGANMAFRRWALKEVDGFDPRFVARGDDDSVAWEVSRLGRLVFVPSATVAHERPRTLRAWLKERKANGKARALLHEYLDERQQILDGRSPRLSRVGVGKLRTGYLALIPVGLLMSLWNLPLGLLSVLLGVSAGLARSAIYFSVGLHTLRRTSASDRRTPGWYLKAGVVAVLSCFVNDISYFRSVWLSARAGRAPRIEPVVEERRNLGGTGIDATEGSSDGPT